MKNKSTNTIPEQYTNSSVMDQAASFLAENHKHMTARELFEKLPSIGILEIYNNDDDNCWWWKDSIPDHITAKIVHVDKRYNTTDYYHLDIHTNTIIKRRVDHRGWCVRGTELEKAEPVRRWA